MATRRLPSLADIWPRIVVACDYSIIDGLGPNLLGVAQRGSMKLGFQELVPHFEEIFIKFIALMRQNMRMDLIWNDPSVHERRGAVQCLHLRRLYRSF